MKCSPTVILRPKPRWGKMSLNRQVKTAVGYVRLSDRAATGNEVSLARQEAEIRAWCDRMGLKLASVHCDIGKSGRKLNREGLDSAVAECSLRGAVLVAYSLDRVARDRRVLERLQAERVPFRCLDLPEMNETLLALVQFVGEIYTRNISDKMKSYHKSRKEKAARGLCEPHPTPKYSPDAETARRTIAHARETRVARTQKRAGYVWEHIKPLVESVTSLHEIAARLNDEGVTAPRGGPWYAAGIARIVSRHSA